MVGFKVEYYWYQIGSGDFLYAFFSTIASNLENRIWGNRFPTIMTQLYQGKIDNASIAKALEELKIIKKELKQFSPDEIVWDLDDPSKQPPWGKNISSEITDLSNYFLTNDGKDFIILLFNALDKAMELNTDLRIKSM